MRRLILFSTAVAVLSLTPLSANSAEAAKAAQFISGTAATIPVNIDGSLDATNPSELQFHYGMSVFTVPYDTITNTQISDAAGHHLWKVPVKLGKSSRLLTISYRNGEKISAVTFKASAGSVASLRAVIEQRRAPAPAAQTAKAQPKTAGEEDWWGDHYWRTTHNRDKWPSPQQTDTTVAPSGTKD